MKVSLASDLNLVITCSATVGQLLESEMTNDKSGPIFVESVTRNLFIGSSFSSSLIASGSSYLEILEITMFFKVRFLMISAYMRVQESPKTSKFSKLTLSITSFEIFYNWKILDELIVKLTN
jgi:hypothetical protein